MEAWYWTTIRKKKFSMVRTTLAWGDIISPYTMYTSNMTVTGVEKGKGKNVH